MLTSVCWMVVGMVCGALTSGYVVWCVCGTGRIPHWGIVTWVNMVFAGIADGVESKPGWVGPIGRVASSSDPVASRSGELLYQQVQLMFGDLLLRTVADGACDTQACEGGMEVDNKLRW